MAEDRDAGTSHSKSKWAWFRMLAYAFETEPNDRLASRLDGVERRLQALEKQSTGPAEG